MSYKSSSDVVNIKQVMIRGKKSRVYRGLKAVKIICMYCKIVARTVINGYAWPIPDDFGTLYVQKNPQIKIRKNLNLKRFGHSYFILMKSEKLEKNFMRFKAHPEFKRDFIKKLTTTNIDYRTELT